MGFNSIVPTWKLPDRNALCVGWQEIFGMFFLFLLKDWILSQILLCLLLLWKFFIGEDFFSCGRILLFGIISGFWILPMQGDICWFFYHLLRSAYHLFELKLKEIDRIKLPNFPVGNSLWEDSFRLSETEIIWKFLTAVFWCRCWWKILRKKKIGYFYLW